MHVAILGNGITGVSAALRLRELDPDCRITMISGESTHHYSRPALMYVFMGHMRYRDTKPYEDATWRERRIDLVRDWVVGIDTEQRSLRLHRGEPIGFDKLVLATGSKPNRFGWPGQDLPGVQGLYGLLDLKALYDNVEDCRRAVVVGGGLIGIELAEMLLSRGIDVTFLVRERTYWGNVLPAEESAMVNELIRHHGCDLRLGTELAEIHAASNGRVGAISTKDGERIECELVGLTAGVSPNLDVVRDTAIAVGRGILVDPQLRTNIDGVYAAGDCAEIVTGDERSTLQQVWYTGRMQGHHVAASILGDDAPFDSGIWFNSAKFFDLEYQTYGQVHRRIPGEENLYWQHPTELVSFRIVHKDGVVIGFNMMGTRYRHEVCERWIRDGVRVRDVLPRLREAAFDPEFFQPYERAIERAFTEQLS